MVLDGCSPHHQAAVHDAIHAVGGLVFYLEPYDPQHMPIEIGFRAAKDWMRRECKHRYNHLPQREQLRLALRNVSAATARQAFHESGFFQEQDPG